jgi:DNA-directed RNA polymerase subunit RPC12/RpoP
MSSREIERLRRTPYRIYLHTRHWKAKKAEALEHYGNECGRCGSKRDLDVHHKTYENLGCESMEDLSIRCRYCHEIIEHREAIPEHVRRARR